MKVQNTFKKHIVIAAILGALSPISHSSETPVAVLICHMDVIAGCFGSKPYCSDKDYQGFIDECNDAYDSAAAIPPKPARAKAVVSVQTQKTAAYKQKIQRIGRTLKQKHNVR